MGDGDTVDRRNRSVPGSPWSDANSFSTSGLRSKKPIVEMPAFFHGRFCSSAPNEPWRLRRLTELLGSREPLLRHFAFALSTHAGWQVAASVQSCVIRTLEK